MRIKRWKIRNKGAIQIPFAWLFAIIVGIIILFLAIYASTKLIGTEQYTLDTVTAKRIGVLTNPLETGFESAEKNFMVLPTETRIYNLCSNSGVFGEQGIKLSQKSFRKWPEPGAAVSFLNKYFFSEEISEGKEFYLFSKPFEFPFKVADVIIIIPKSKEYCFEGAPDDIQEEIEDLEFENIKFEDCSEGAKKVCFGDYGCDIYVDYDNSYVDNENERVYFNNDALMYAGIFSDKDIYECQIGRLMKRTEQLALLYKDKSVFVSQRGCSSEMSNELLQLISGVSGVSSSIDLMNVKLIADSIKDKNNLMECRLW